MLARLSSMGVPPMGETPTVAVGNVRHDEDNISDDGNTPYDSCSR